MSLKVFHIVFVAVTVVLSAYVVLWGALEFARKGSVLGLALGLVFLATAVVMSAYGRKVFVKLRDLP